jgi:hypothetical protein
MLSDRLICPHCGDEKTNKEGLFSVEVLDSYVIHLFCIKCGMGFQVSVQDNQYNLEKISSEE